MNSLDFSVSLRVCLVGVGIGRVNLGELLGSRSDDELPGNRIVPHVRIVAFDLAILFPRQQL